MKVIIVAGGTPPSKTLIDKQISHDSIVIAVDRGADCLLKYKITPDYLIGDFDSISTETLNYFYTKSCNIERYNSEKDESDTELAILKAKELNADEIVFLGCTGSRLDHTLVNINLLYKCLKYKIKSSIIDSNNLLCLTDTSVEISGDKGQYFSVLPYYSDVKGLTIRGAKYCLNNYNLNIGSSLTLSNQFKETTVDISFASGILLILKSFD
ncbi:thiamine diphosphokinase [Clostridium sp. YIM B02515]|uniref:Thiamine diphosphokinase n=1 Tax=Clostridium rhizosphaerae TaxID=2803861 RepID=A0ABS1T6H8_9CLOT|nr:thiamine diphosphokinase [Clostridium rhizosphaerae]MBL4934944.1 thiamine diphosphokinase [Clostridium rhizosphaerae]